MAGIRAGTKDGVWGTPFVCGWSSIAKRLKSALRWDEERPFLSEFNGDPGNLTTIAR